ncbi:hypothetical protein [Paractinoplanes ferrugineus]|uniref:hypothetical protein n=1 Tax=Paractinoplanes ferrugineus TaxID=113564 RepID=UPI001941B629|nr:hypothetical protein [Actinoplanes ferrugineus]
MIDQASAIDGHHSANALGAFDDIGTDGMTRNARHVPGWIERTGCTAFTRRPVFRAPRRLPRVPSRVRCPFSKLADICEGLEPPAWSHTNGRPPSLSYFLYPRASARCIRTPGYRHQQDVGTALLAPRNTATNRGIEPYRSLGPVVMKRKNCCPSRTESSGKDP